MFDYFDLEDIRDICRGNLLWRKCQECDSNARQYWDKTTGLGLSASPVGIPSENLADEPCEVCRGIGYIFYRK